jgi:formiminoglutamase
MNLISKHNTFYLSKISSANLNDFTSKRKGEIKIGEKISLSESLNQKYLLLGIEEDFGPQLNGGKMGSRYAFSTFLSKFVNIQSNDFLKGDEILLLGSIQSNLKNFEKDSGEIISELDDFIVEVLLPYMEKGYIPIVVGGGHNNAYPLIKASFLARKSKINVVNLDAHADMRLCDIRHSGNPFSFAFQDEFIQLYSVLGLHQSYNNQYIINELKRNNCFFTWFDDYLLDTSRFQSDVLKTKELNNSSPFGIELDLDAISFMPSSAFSPSGFTVEEARYYIKILAKNDDVCYLHLPEGAPQNETEDLIVGKTLAYLVSDFIKSNFSKNVN